MRETKAFRLEVKAVDEAAGTFTGYAAVFGNRDSYGDVIEPGAFAKTLADNAGVFPVLWQHDPYEPIGVSTSMEEDEKGLRVEAAISTETQRGRESLSLMKIGAVRGLSIGFETIQRQMDAGVRRLTELKLYEFSPVTFPANELALVTGVKSERLLAALASWAKDAKEGRVLSAGNRSLVESARDALQALLDAAEPPAGTQDGKGAAAPAPEPAFATPGAIVNHVFGGSR